MDWQHISNFQLNLLDQLPLDPAVLSTKAGQLRLDVDLELADCKHRVIDHLEEVCVK